MPLSLRYGAPGAHGRGPGRDRDTRTAPGQRVGPVHREAGRARAPGARHTDPAARTAGRLGQMDPGRQRRDRRPRPDEGRHTPPDAERDVPVRRSAPSAQRLGQRHGDPPRAALAGCGQAWHEPACGFRALWRRRRHRRAAEAIRRCLAERDERGAQHGPPGVFHAVCQPIGRALLPDPAGGNQRARRRHERGRLRPARQVRHRRQGHRATAHPPSSSRRTPSWRRASIPWPGYFARTGSARTCDPARSGRSRPGRGADHTGPHPGPARPHAQRVPHGGAWPELDLGGPRACRIVAMGDLAACGR